MSYVRQNNPAVTLSVRISSEAREQLEKLSDVTHRTKSFLAAEAIECYLAVQTWQVKAVEKSLAKANSKKANFVSHDKVVDWLNSWGTEAELESPK
jgi:RHH-type transcriptional regulator, rel operon repressor / antitoxin RelB